MARSLRLVAGRVLAVAWLACGAAQAAETCDLVSLDQVRSALPGYEWRLSTGGPGGCQFDGLRAGQPLSLNLLQQFFATPAEAAATLRDMRAAFDKTYAVAPLNLRGAAPGAFIYDLSGPGGAGPSSTSWYAQNGRGVLSGMFMPPGGSAPSAVDMTGLRSLLQTALDQTGQPAAAAQSAQCLHVDPGLARKLLGTQTVKIEQFGSDSCIASVPRGGVLNFARMRDLDATMQSQLAESMVPHDCTNEPVPGLGAQGLLSYRCGSGAKRVQVAFFQHGERLEYSFMPAGNREPSAQQRADLLALARRQARP